MTDDEKHLSVKRMVKKIQTEILICYEIHLKEEISIGK